MEIVDELEHELQVSRLCAHLLAVRGIASAEEGTRFLGKRLKDLIPPERLTDMDRAAARFADAINNRERILIHGDYDVDGSTSVALLKHFVRVCGHDAEGWIPHRSDDGYGLSDGSYQAVKDHQAQLMVTVDCGIADGGWAGKIEADLGCDVVVTDHHLPQGSLPDCHAAVNPNRPDCTYPDKGIAGVGVAWKLCWATAKILSDSDQVTDRLRTFLMESLAFVAVGTVADCAPLDQENRILVHHGLLALQRTQFVGLRLLLQETRLEGSPLQSADIGWKIGPLLNASGRLGSAMRNIDLLCCADHESGRKALDLIVTENQERRRLSQQLTEELITEIDTNPAYRERQTLVFAGDHWHPGVVGIVASRLIDRYGKPTAVIGILDGVGKGSLRTVPHVHLGKAITACKHLLINGGGHAAAAGLTIDPMQVTDFSDAFEAYVRDTCPAGIPAPAQDFDCTTPISSMDPDFFAELEALAPFGEKNPLPVVRVERSTFVTRPDFFGRTGDHLRGAITDDQGGMLQLLAWSARKKAPQLASERGAHHLLVTPQINHWRGEKKPQLVLVDAIRADHEEGMADSA